MFEEHNPNFVLVCLCLACRKFEIFWCPNCQMAAPIAFFRGSLLPETFEHVSIVFDYGYSSNIT